MTAPTRPGFDLEDCTFGSCQLTVDDFTRAISDEPRTRALVRGATVAGTGACAAGLALVAGPRDVAGGLLLATGFLCFAAHQAPEHLARRWYERMPRAARTQRYTLNSRELIVSSEASRSSYAWPSVLGCHETPEAFLIWVNARFFLIVPKRAFSESDLARVSRRLREENLGGPPPALRLWLWLLVAAIVGFALLWLWNYVAPR